jgi:membrane-associated protease RseP (regulator of RpoE activity)
MDSREDIRFVLEPGSRPAAGPRRFLSSPSFHAALLLATFCTTLVAGSLFHAESSGGEWESVLANPSRWWDGAPYALSLLAILLAHEMGHYLACRRYGVDASLPYFLPGLPILGTFGAFIRIRARIPDRRTLFDVGVAGPIAGFVVTIPVFLYGMQQSRLVPPAEMAGSEYVLGMPLLFSLVAPLYFPEIPEGWSLYGNPYLSAAWVGLLATSLNLLPAGQLDGGHICYAVSRRFHSAMSRLTLIAVILLGALHQAWLVWAVILLFLGDRHPPLLDESGTLSAGRRLVAVAALLLLLLSFIPVPLRFVP